MDLIIDIRKFNFYFKATFGGLQTAEKPESTIYCTYENAKLLHIVIAVTSGSAKGGVKIREQL